MDKTKFQKQVEEIGKKYFEEIDQIYSNLPLSFEHKENLIFRARYRRDQAFKHLIISSKKKTTGIFNNLRG